MLPYSHLLGRPAALAAALMAALILTTAPALADRTLTFQNDSQQTVWVGGSNASGLTGDITGFELAAGASKDITIPDTVISASFWPRLGCRWVEVPYSKDGTTYYKKQFQCTIGDCGSAAYGYTVQCNGGTKSPPANNVELNLEVGGDYYDLSNVGGLSMSIEVYPTGSTKKVPGVSDDYNCTSAATGVFNINWCPPELSYTDEFGNFACYSICKAVSSPTMRAKSSVLQAIYNDDEQRLQVCCACGDCGDPAHGYQGGCVNCCCCDTRSKYCCSPYIKPANLCPNSPTPTKHGGICHVEDWPKPDADWCKKQGIPTDDCRYDRLFKAQCPQAYSWQFNDGSSTFQCAGAPDYTIIFSDVWAEPLAGNNSIVPQ